MTETTLEINFMRIVLDRAQFDNGIVNTFYRKDGKSLACETFRNHQGLMVRGTISLIWIWIPKRQ